MSAALDQLATHRVVPVVIADSVAQGTLIADALVAGGLPVAEVTYRTSAASEVIETLAARGDVLVGAGTVVTAAQVDDAVTAGARFLVSPGFHPAVAERAAAHGVPLLPGAVTATEIMAALNAGIRTVKFFPAEASGGVTTLRALSAAFVDVSFVPTGGVGPANLADYLSVPSVRAVGGSWMLPGDAVARGDVAALTRLTAQAVAAAAP